LVGKRRIAVKGWIGAAGLFLGFLAGCAPPPTGPSNSAPYSQTDLREGTGTEAANGKTLTVEYTGWLFDSSEEESKGLQFDSSRGRAPFTFTLGVGQVIQGWDQGLVGMKVGGLRKLVIPPELAYGEIRSGPIPPDSTLVFEVELQAVED
jgi:FKBP-type peptidyl-prolyl cis-trans isomerase FkpA